MIHSAELEARLDHIIAPVMNNSTPGMVLLIVQKNRILIHKAYGLADLETGRPVAIRDHFAIASNTKQFTCIAVAMLKERGLLHFDETIEKFFPDFPGYTKEVTIRHLMNHQSGIPDYTEETAWLAREKAANGITAEMLQYIQTLGSLQFTPGSQFSYSNSGYVMLGSIIEQLSGKPFGRFLEEDMMHLIGMNDSYAPNTPQEKAPRLVNGYSLEENGVLTKQPYDMALIGYADGNIQTTAEDMMKWHHYLYESSNETLLKRSSLSKVFSERIPSNLDGLDYGFGFIKSVPPQRPEIWHGGGTMGFASRCSRYPEDNLSIIMLSNYQGLPKYELYNQIAAEVFSALDEVK